MTAILYAVSPEQLGAAWPIIVPDVENIASRSRGRYLSDDIREMIASGDRLLWVALNESDGAYLGLAMAELHQYPRRKACRLVACTGRERARWLPLLSGIEAWAKSVGCDVMESFARKGWARELSTYKMSHCFLERDL